MTFSVPIIEFGLIFKSLLYPLGVKYNRLIQQGLKNPNSSDYNKFKVYKKVVNLCREMKVTKKSKKFFTEENCYYKFPNFYLSKDLKNYITSLELLKLFSIFQFPQSTYENEEVNEVRIHYVNAVICLSYFFLTKKKTKDISIRQVNSILKSKWMKKFNINSQFSFYGESKTTKNIVYGIAIDAFKQNFRIMMKSKRRALFDLTVNSRDINERTDIIANPLRKSEFFGLKANKYDSS